jgi:hypothetical protein
MWPQIITTALGVWLMAAPAVLAYGRPASTNDYIIGPIVSTFACIALWEATRAVRWVNLPLGLWLIAAPLVLGHPQAGAVNSVLCGIAIAVLSCLGGRAEQRFGGGWAAVWRGAPVE